MPDIPFKKGNLVHFKNAPRDVCYVEKTILPGKIIRNGQRNTTGETLYVVRGATVFIPSFIRFLVHADEIELNH